MFTDTTPAQNQTSQITLPADPHAAEQAQFAADLDAITREIEAEFNANQADEYLDEDSPPQEGEAPPAEGDHPPVEAPAKDEDDPAVAKGLDRLVAREVALKVREDAAAAAEAKAQALLAEVRKYESLKPTAEVQAQLDFDPFGVVKGMGKDPMEVARLLLAQAIEAAGKPVPPELKEINEKAADRRWKTSMERQLAEKDRQLAAQNYFTSVQAEARQYVTKVGDSTPTVKAVATANPDLVHAEIMEEISKDAQAKAARDPNAPLMTFEEAAKRIEDRWGKLRGAIAPVSPAGTDPNKNAPGAKKIVPPQIKPPAKPIAPWLARSTEDHEQRGIQEAMREFNRAEAEAKRRR